MFILYAPNTEDLILNCIACEFIVTADELIASSILPAYAIQTIEEVEVYLPYAPSKNLKPTYNKVQMARAILSHFFKLPILLMASTSIITRIPQLNQTISKEMIVTGSFSAVVFFCSVISTVYVSCKKKKNTRKINPASQLQLKVPSYQ